MERGGRWTSDRLVGREPQAGGRPRLLLLCDYEANNAATVLDHIEAIRAWSASDVYVLPMFRDLPADLDLGAFDGLVIHYNLVMAYPTYLSPLARWRIRSFQGVKGAFIQDEYRFVNDTVGVMRSLGIQVLFTCVPEDQVPLVYPAEALPAMRRIATVLTGYVPQELLSRPVVPYDQRPIDVGYRARRLPPWLGDLGQEKSEIADRFAADAPAHGLTVDISCREEDRIYGEAWVEFMSLSKAMLGVESGASVFDFDGSIEAGIRAHLAKHPDAGYAELHRLFMADVDGQIRLNQISPRCFEAAALGTLMVLYPGNYSGILQPWRHYVPLEKDHSNMAEVAAAIRDRATWERITAFAREEVARNPDYSFRSVAETLDAALDLQARAGGTISPERFSAIAAHSLAAIAGLRRRPGGRLGRLRRAAELAVRALKPSRTALVASPGSEPGTSSALRKGLQRWRALAWWLMRPRRLPPALLLARGTRLLVDLGRLGLLQEMGQAALAAGVPSPFRLVADRAAGELRVEHGGPGPASEDPPELPADLAWASRIDLALSDPWLAPVGIPGAGRSPLPELSRLLRSHPNVVGRLLQPEDRWCALLTKHSTGDREAPSVTAGRAG